MKQELKLQQKLILTPQLLLNLKLLALPTLELEQVLREEIEKNPCLEESLESEEALEEEEKTKGEDPSLRHEARRKDEEFDYTDLLPEEGYYSPTIRTEEEPSDFSPPAPESPIDAIIGLIRAELPKEDHPYAEYILQSLDEDGFLTMTREEILQNLEIDEDKLKKILQVIKSIEPGGIGAFTKQEAFLAQLEKRGFSSDSLEYRIIENFYEPWLKMDYKTIAKEIKKELKEVEKALTNLKILEPRPLRQYYSNPLTYIEPDFEIKIEGDQINIFFRDEYLPSLRIASYYRDVLNNPNSYTAEEVAFAKEKVRNALKFIKAISARKKMLNKIVCYITEKQAQFFRSGSLLPLTIKDCAKDLGIHPSIISRAIVRKYLSTPTGIFPLRYFFSSGIGEKSKVSVKERVKQLIENEDPSSPLTDDEIVSRLKEEGVNIARRTVVKYREELKILSSRKRKKGTI
ncbi:MAG: RNA polymerase factor sigma-54 [candidate division WOR-3 bacterium]